MSWEDLLERAATTRLDKVVLRDLLPIEYVLAEELGLQLDEQGQTLCPFHEDTRPSFAIFEAGDGIERAGCWSCGWRGDVFDVIMRTRGCSFGDAVYRAQTLLQHVGEVVRRTPMRPTLGAEALTEIFDNARARADKDDSPIERLLIRRGLRMTASWLRDTWDVGVASSVGAGAVLIPHYDAMRQATGYKTRIPGSPTIAAKGSKFPALYGAWRDRSWRRVIITEGESDAWTASWLAGHLYDVLSVPTGAGTPPRAEWMPRFEEVDVVLGFDADEAGLRATWNWAEALAPVARHVRYLHLPWKQDLSSVLPAVIMEQLHVA